MSVTNFQLTFAGVPFVADRATLIRMNPGGGAGGENAIYRWQAESDLIEEINRALDFEYLHDFAVLGDYIGKDTSALARTKYGKMPGVEVKISDWYYPTGASRWSVFRGLMTSTMVQAVVANLSAPIQPSSPSASQAPVPNWGPGTFIMSAPYVGPQLGGHGSPDPTQPAPSNYFIQTQMHMLPPRPLGDHGSQFDGLYLITLVDERYWFQNSPATTAGIGEFTTWDTLIGGLAEALNITLSFYPTNVAYGQPEPDSQFWANVESAAVLLDAAAQNTGRTVVRNMNGNYTLQESALAAQIVNANRQGAPPQDAGVGGDFVFSGLLASGGSVFSGWYFSGTTGFTFPVPAPIYSGNPYKGSNFPDVRLAGGELFSTNSGSSLLAGDLSQAKNAAIPFEVQVTFPQYVYGDDPVPHFANPRVAPQRQSAWNEDSYGSILAVTVPINSGGPYVDGTIGSGGISGWLGVSGYSHTIKNTAKAYYSGESVLGLAPVNNSGLTALAIRTAESHYTRAVATALDEVFAGTYAWQPEGLHDIIWRYSERARLASTRIMRTQWNDGVRDLQNALPVPSGAVPGLGPLSDIPRGVGGRSVAQTWRDQANLSIASGTPSTPLAASLNSGDMACAFTDFSYFPTQNRWKGQIDQEIILFEGTSGVGLSFGAAVIPPGGYVEIIPIVAPTTPVAGVFFQEFQFDNANNAFVVPATSNTSGIVVYNGDPVGANQNIDLLGVVLTSGIYTPNGLILSPSTLFVSGSSPSVQIVYRGIDGTIETNHFASGFIVSGALLQSGSSVRQLTPNTTYGVNSLKMEKGQFLYPNAWTLNGIQEVSIVPQVQNVYIFDGSGQIISGTCYFSGQVNTYTPTLVSGSHYVAQDFIWAIERNSGSLLSGVYYEGQLVGTSPFFSGTSTSGFPLSGQPVSSGGSFPAAPLYIGSVAGGGSAKSGTSAIIQVMTNQDQLGFYPGNILKWMDAPAPDRYSLTSNNCYIDTANRETLRVNDAYNCTLVGMHSGLPVFGWGDPAVGCSGDNPGNTVQVVTGFNTSSCVATLNNLAGTITICGVPYSVTFTLN